MDINKWVASYKGEEDKRFRKAMHLVLLAISRDKNASHHLVLKGGIVMSLVYGGTRYTSDLDASSILSIDELTPERLERDLSRNLVAAELDVGYGLAFKIHSVKPQPKMYEKAQYPAYKVKIGFAQQNNPSEMQRLANKQSASTVDIDISFNEVITLDDTECIELSEGRNILCYSLAQIMGEKYRSLLQQPVRNRNRRQDVYDIHHLLTEYADYFSTEEVKQDVLNKLKKCSEGKKIDKYLQKNGIDDEEVKAMALKDFETLELEIDINKIDPNIMFDEISTYFQSLPW